MPAGAPGVPKKHGLCIGNCGGPEYRILAGIKGRCYNPRTPNFHRYGERGIKVCERWLHGEDGLAGVECFIKDMGPRPSPRHSIERIENDGNYEPANCRWATDREQSNNTRRNRFLEFEGVSYTFAQASRKFGIPYARLRARIEKLGWSADKAIKESRYGV